MLSFIFKRGQWAVVLTRAEILNKQAKSEHLVKDNQSSDQTQLSLRLGHIPSFDQTHESFMQGCTCINCQFVRGTV